MYCTFTAPPITNNDVVPFPWKVADLILLSTIAEPVLMAISTVTDHNHFLCIADVADSFPSNICIHYVTTYQLAVEFRTD